MKRPWFVLLALCMTSVATGCGGNYTVKGQVVFPDGTPVPGLDGRGVSFESIEGHYSAVATIDSEGRFELYSIKSGDGVRPGKYRVMIPALPPPMAGDLDILAGKKLSKPTPPPPDPIHAKYRSVETSGLEVVIDRSTSDLKLTVEPASSTKGKEQRGKK